MTIRSFSFTLLIVLLSPVANAQWVEQLNGLPGSWSGMAIDACDSNTAVISTGRILYRTVDRGESWHQLTPLTTVIDVSVVDSSHIWVVTDSGLGASGYDAAIYATSDAGQHWTLQFHDPAATAFLDYIRMFDLSRGIAMGDPAYLGSGPPLFARTTDGGTHWTQMNDSLSGLYSSDTWREVSFVGPDVGYFFESSTLPRLLYRTTTGGSSWVATNFSPQGIIPILNFYNEAIGLAATTRRTGGGISKRFCIC